MRPELRAAVTVLLPCGLTALAVLALRPPVSSLDRLQAPPTTDRTPAAVRPPTGTGRERTAPARRAGSGARRAAGAALGAVAAWVWGGPAGVALGLALGVGVGVLLTGLETRDERVLRERVEADLPVAADLLAVAVQAGATLDRAAEVVGSCLGGPLGAALLRVVAATADWGADPVQAWSSLAAAAAVAGRRPSRRARRPDDLARFGAAVGRALARGAPPGPALARLAADCRARAGAEAAERAGRVATRVVLPLAVCFLPAFVLLSVVPMVLSIGATALEPLR